MKALRILMLVLFLPVYVSAVLADAADQGGSVSTTLQISSIGADLDLLCDKLKQTTLSGSILQYTESASARSCFLTEERAVTTTFLVLLPFSLRAPPFA
jgi:hypothetical protein